MDRRQFLAGSASALAAAATLTAPTDAQAQANMDALIAAAKKEGQVAFYDSQSTVEAPGEIIKAFEAKYGIKVNRLMARGAELMERIRVEQTTNKVGGDVVLVGATGIVPMSRQNLLVTPDTNEIPNLKNIRLDKWAKEDIPVFVVNYGICINTDMVKPADEPKTWRDLANPKWKGKIISDEMTTASPGATWFSVMLDAFGPEFHEQMAKQDIQYTRITPEKPKRVAQGEFAISLQFGLQELAQLQGLPIKGLVPSEGAPYTPVSLALIKDAKSPNAAKLFTNFFFEPENMLRFAKVGFPTAANVPLDQVPPQWRFALEAKLLGHADVDRADERYALAGKIYSRK